MSVCFKCKKSVKPASLAVTVQGEKYHPTCLMCGKCDKPIWGKPFKRLKDGKIVCENESTCQQKIEQAQRPASSSSTSSKRVDKLSEQFRNNFNLQSSSSYAISSPVTSNSNQLNANKFCRLCKLPLINKRFVTFENEEMICDDCNQNLNDSSKQQQIKRIPSAHLIVCSMCRQTLKGCRYITEENGQIMCVKCDANRVTSSNKRCSKCTFLFRPNEPMVNLNNQLMFHYECLDCSNCLTNINRNMFYLNETNGLPLCLSCFEISKLPKCFLCQHHISDEYLIIQNQPVHNKCFKCFSCNQYLIDGSFVREPNGQLVCHSCNTMRNNKLQQNTCSKCSNLIENSGIMYANNNYHLNCFKCDLCHVELANMKQTLSDNKNQGMLYCEPCFTKFVLPKCNKCMQPIHLTSSSVNYENQLLHTTCFNCARCKKSLADKKFFKSGSLLICESCF